MAAKVVQINSFCGGSSKLVDSEFLGMEETINMYPETVTATDTYSTKVLKSVEGFAPGEVYGKGQPFKAFCATSNDDLVYVTGSIQVPVEHWVTRWGAETDIGYFNATENGHKTKMLETANGYLLILCGGKIAIADPSTTSQNQLPYVTLPDAFDHNGKIVPTQMAQLNFRVVLNDEDSDYIYWSELNRPSDANDTHAFEQALTQYAYTKTDGTVVAFTDNVYYAPAEGTYQAGTLTTQTSYTSSLNSMKMDFKADKVVALRATDSHLFVFGTKSLQVLAWQNSTTAPFAIVAKTSAVGLSFADAVTVIGEECYFVGRGSNGMLGVWAVDGAGAVRKVSDYAIDQRLSNASNTMNVITSLNTFAYSYKGHSFFVVSIESTAAFTGDVTSQTICYDIVENSWTDRASYDAQGNRLKWCAIDSVEYRYLPFFACITAEGRTRITSFMEGFSSDWFLEESQVSTTDNYIQKSRTTGIKYNGVNDIVVTALELVINNGATDVVNPSLDGYNPKVMLQVSTDGGRTWSNELWAYAGKVGQYTYRTRWNCLGRGSRFAFRVKMSDPVPFEIATAYLSYLPCGNRL